MYFFSLFNGHGFDPQVFVAGRKPCWIFGVLAVCLSGFVKCVGLTNEGFPLILGVDIRTRKKILSI